MSDNKLLWWEDKVGYQIYPRSFYDANNDGEGDLIGITEKLPVLKDLGIEIVYISPIFTSPMHDNGYDVANYCDINPMFGTMQDFDKLLAKAKELDLKVMLDIVPNHTSTEHEWFKKAQAGDKKYQDYYITTKDPIWEVKSVFGGDAWKKLNDGDLYYLHTFAPEQADLNWENPLVLEEFINITNFWLKKGVRGFRFDVIDHLGQNKDFNHPETFFKINPEKLHRLTSTWAKASWKKYDAFTIGESWSSDLTNTITYTNKDSQELDACFALLPTMYDYQGDTHMKKHPVILPKLKASISRIQTGIYEGKGRVGLILNNHDMPRQISRFGDENYRIDSGKTLSLTIFGLHGVPFIYQGDEIGMINTDFPNLKAINDVAIHQLKNTFPDMSEKDFMEKIRWMHRDNARTPYQWSNTKNAGFNKSATPWLMVNTQFPEINLEVDLTQGNNSLFKWYQSLINFRKDPHYHEILVNGDYQLHEPDDEKLFIYSRNFNNKKLTFVANWSNKEVSIDDKYLKGDIIINTKQEFTNKTLQPWQSIIVKN